MIGRQPAATALVSVDGKTVGKRFVIEPETEKQGTVALGTMAIVEYLRRGEEEVAMPSRPPRVGLEPPRFRLRSG